MGCDIHMAVEHRTENGWHRVLPPEHAYSPWLVEMAEKESDSWAAERVRLVWYDDRNYRLFGALANVRNGYGFAGITTGDPVVPIALPRGFPEDMSPEVQSLVDGENEDDIWMGDHSFSWLLLSELLAYDWTGKQVVRGVVPLDAFVQRLLEHGKGVPAEVSTHPYKEWSGAISGRHIVTMEAHVVIAHLNNGGLAVQEGTRVYVQDAWRMNGTEAIGGDFLTRVIPALQEIDPDPENVRIVFGFDS